MDNLIKATGDTACPAVMDFQGEALFLAKHYGMMLRDRDRLKAMLEGSWVYTIDDAIAEMDSISVSYDRERVQSSNISNPVERIVMKVTDPAFMARKQWEKDIQKAWCEGEYRYTLWKLDIVETAMRERMEKRDRGIFKKCFAEGWTYQTMKSRFKGNLDNKQIARSNRKTVQAIADQLRVVHGFEADSVFGQRLTREAAAYWTEVQDGKTEENQAEG